MYSSKILVRFLPFSRRRAHDLFNWWNHVKLCVGFLYFEISYLFFFTLHSDMFFFAAPIPTIVIRVYQFVATYMSTMLSAIIFSFTGNHLNETIWNNWWTETNILSSFQSHIHFLFYIDCNRTWTWDSHNLLPLLYWWARPHWLSIPYLETCMLVTSPLWLAIVWQGLHCPIANPNYWRKMMNKMNKKNLFFRWLLWFSVLFPPFFGLGVVRGNLR